MKTAVFFGRVLGALILAGITTTAIAVGPTHTVTITPSSATYGAVAGRITFTVTMAYSEASLSGLGIQLVAPAGWQFVSPAGGPHVPDVSPGDGQIGNLPFAYVKVPASTVSFTFTVSYPAGLTGNQVFTTVRTNFTDEATGNPVIESWSNIIIASALSPVAIGAPPANQTGTRSQSATLAVTGMVPTLAWTKGISKP